MKIIIFSFLITLLACQPSTNDNAQESNSPSNELHLVTPSGDVIEASLAYTIQDTTQGLSGVDPDEFDDNDGKLFFYITESSRSFWMPDTYFDLDIIYLDKDFNITEIIWNMPHHPGREDPAEIPRAPAIYSRHVLEMKSGSAVSGSLRVGHQLRWKSPMTPQQIESRIHQQQ